LYKNIVERYPGNVFGIMLSSPSRRPELKRLILRECGLGDEINYQINSPALPFAMLEAETLAKLQAIVGALACFKDIVKIVGKRDLASIFDLIDRDVYTFIVKRSLVFWKKIPKLDSDFPEKKLEKRIPMCGKLIIEHVISTLPESVVKRMNMRSGMEFKRRDSIAQEEISKSMELVKYALTNFFSDREDAKLCLK
jgi:hypothetical protein